MFEYDNTANIWRNQAVRNQRTASDNADAAREARDVNFQWQAHAAGLEARIAELEGKLALAEMETAGRRAQMDALSSQHPDSPLLANTQEVFVMDALRGNPKTFLRRIYEKAFDAKGVDMKISHPEAWRSN